MFAVIVYTRQIVDEYVWHHQICQRVVAEVVAKMLCNIYIFACFPSVCQNRGPARDIAIKRSTMEYIYGKCVLTKMRSHVFVHNINRTPYTQYR